MLQFIQKQVSGWIAWVLIIIIGLGFVLWGVENYFQQKASSDEAIFGTVNNMPIYQSDIDRIVKSMTINFDQSEIKNSPDYKKLIQKSAFEVAVLYKTILASAQNLGLYISDDSVNNIITRSESFYVDGKFAPEKFSSILKALGFKNVNEFFEYLKSDILLNQVKFSLVNSDFATASEFTNWYRIIDQTRDIRYLTIPRSIYEKENKLTSDELMKYYETHKDSYFQDEQASLNYVELNLSDVKKQIKVTSEEIVNYYSQYKKNYIEPIKWRAAHIWLKSKDGESKEILLERANEIINKLNSGEKFSDLAKKYSDDKLTASEGGELHWFGEGAVDKIIEDSVKDLKKIGDHTKPIITSTGIEIIKLLDIKRPKEKQLSEVENQIKNIIINEKSQKLFSELSEELADLSFNNPDSLKEVSDKLHLPIQKTGLFEKKLSNVKSKVSDTSILKFPQVLETAFSPEVYIQNSNSPPINLDNERIIVIRINNKIPKKLKSFSEVKTEVEKDLMKQIVDEKIQNFGKGLMQKLINSQSINKELNGYSLSWHSAKDVGRKSNNISEPIKELAFNTVKTIGKPNYNSTLLENGDFLLLELVEIHYPKESKDIQKVDSSIQDINNSIANHYGSTVFKVFIEELKEKSKIKLNNLEFDSATGSVEYQDLSIAENN